MPENQLNRIIDRIARMQSGWTEQTALAALRADLDALYASFEGVAGSQVESLEINGVPVDRVLAPGVDGGELVVLFHGGGFSMGSALSHRHLAQWLSRAADCCVLIPDYRLVPEHVYPAQLEDARAVFEGLLAQGHKPRSIALAGDSAGGGLVLALIADLQRAARPLPTCACLMSPWLDLECRGDSYRSRAQLDPVATHEMALGMGRGYVGQEGDTSDPLASPINLDFCGFPPLLIQVGGREIFIDDALSAAASARQGGVSVELKEWPNMIHQWHLYAAELDEGRQAIEELAVFLQMHLR